MPRASPSPTPDIVLRVDDLSGAQTRNMLRLHLEGMHANSPPGRVFALDLSGLLGPAMTVWSAWCDETIAGIGALKALPGNHAAIRKGEIRQGEIKSMRTHPQFLRRGVAAALLERIIGEARARGMTRLSLETGSGPAFDPALALYFRRGFVEGEAFGDYVRSGFNRFLHLDLANRAGA